MKKNKRVIICPLFMKSAEICKDDFWRQLLEDMAYGKPPKNIFVNHSASLITCVGKSKAMISYENMDEKEILEKIIPFLQTHTSIYSCSDIKKRHNLMEQLKKEKDQLKSLKWSQIRKSTYKKILLLDFVNVKRVEHKLSWDKTRLLYRDLIEVVCKQGMSKKVEYIEGQIVYIEGLEFSEGDYNFLKNFDDLQKVLKSQKKTTKWESYIKKYLKTIYQEFS